MRISDWSSDVCSSDLDILARPGQPKLDVNVNVGVTRPGEDVYEVALKINVTAKVESATSFAVELLYNGLFGLRNVPEEALQPFLLVERSEEHTSELQSLMRISYAVFCLKKKNEYTAVHAAKPLSVQLWNVPNRESTTDHT